MVEISHRERVVRAKIIYYGPAAGGKTTNLVVLHRRADPKRRGEMVSVNSTPHGPDWLTSELLGMGKELSRTKRFRDAGLCYYCLTRSNLCESPRQSRGFTCDS